MPEVMKAALEYGSQGSMILVALYIAVDRVKWSEMVKRLERMSARLQRLESLMMGKS